MTTKPANPLTPSVETFATSVASGLTQADAFRKAYPHAQKWQNSTVWARASNLAGKGTVQARIAELSQKAAQANEVTVERVFKEAARIALFDPRKLFNDDGSPKAISELDDDTAAAIAGIEVVTKGNAELGFAEIIKFKIADKNSALEKLFKFHGMYERDNKQKTDPLAEVLRQLHGSALPITKNVQSE